MASWSICVTIHNLVNIPLAACENGPRTFAVEAHMLHRASAYSAPVVAAIFTTDDVVSTTPNLFEVRLDEVAVNTSGNGGGPKVWRCALPEMEAVVMVKEVVGGFTGAYQPRSRGDDSTAYVDGASRVVGSSAPVALNVKDVVEVDKLATRVVGTEMGQVGISFTVDPSDKIGYQQRLESFLRVHNPQGLRLVPNVVAVVSELDTFTKLYRRYKIRNYEERLRAFFDVYGAQFKQEIPSLLRQWEGREEELMRNLILDNGPELTTVERHQRLTAYLAAHGLDRKSPDVQALLARYAEDPDQNALFAALVQRYGTEPDPRTYLFVTPRYTPAARTPPPAGRSAISVVQRSPLPATGRPARTTRGSPGLPTTPRPSEGSSAPRRSPPTPAGDHHPPYLSVAMSPTPKAADEAPRETARSLSKSPSFRAGREEEERAKASRSHAAKNGGVVVRDGLSAITPSDSVFVSDAAVSGAGRGAGGRRAVSLWRKMCSMMQTRHHGSSPWREYQLFFMSPDEFVAAVRALHIFHDGGSDGEDEVHDLVGEWERRVTSALKEEQLPAADAYYGAAVQEAAALTRLQPLHLQVLSLSTLFHKEQYSGFSSYVDEMAKAAKTERLVLVGDVSRLMDIARFGIHASSSMSGVLRSALSSAKESGSTQADAPLLFFREPFYNCSDQVSCGILVCEVAVGNTYVCPAAVHTPHEPTADFLAAYDSCSYVDEAKGPVLAVYARQQVFPRLLLRCVVDPRLQPCPAHPDRPVEYYVVDTHAFACSRCVVLGAYKGKDVISIEEAAVLARGGLAEVEQTTSALKESMLAYASQLRNEEDGMSTAPRRVEAEREIDRLQKEVEERIRLIRRQVQLEDEAQLSRIRADRAEVEATMAAADRLSSQLDSAMHLSTPAGIVNALRHIQQENEVEQLLARVQARVPAAPLERVLPLDGPPTAPSNSAAHPVKAVAGLNESRLPTGNAGKREGRATPRQQNRSPAAPRSSLPHRGTSDDGDLYSQYLALAGEPAAPGATAASASVSKSTPQPYAPSLHKSGAASDRRAGPASLPSTDASDSDANETSLAGKESLTQGWAFLRRGDVAGAQRAWTAVCRAHGTNDVLGTKAHAYIAEAIQKDYTAAAQWYARSLQLDPQDRMTAYNYGVLLEALLDQPREALRMYDRAASLGDGMAAARARELRASMPA